MTERPVDPLADAVAWKASNRAAYAQMVEWARSDMAMGRQPSAKLYIEVLRRPHFVRMLGLRIRRASGPVLIKNAVTANLARLIMREYPDVVFPTARAKADTWAAG